MRLLILTQAVDSEDPVLGFFHGWLREFADHYEHIHVVCLREGKHALPPNISVRSLGKEKGRSRIGYIARLYSLIWSLRAEYDAVFVHMNQEYVLLGGVLWKLLGKRAFLWRNHYAGSLWTALAVALSAKVFCTSKFSYTARYRKTILMPVGVDTGVFMPRPVRRDPRAILFLSRMAPSKRPHLLLDALALLHERGAQFSASFYGSPIPRDERYYEDIKKRARDAGLTTVVRFHEGVPNVQTPRIYNAHGVFVNCSASGMYDKTIFEAAACGCIVLASSRDLAESAGERFVMSDGDAKDLADKLEAVLSLSETQREAAVALFTELARAHSLTSLGARLAAGMRG